MGGGDDDDGDLVADLARHHRAASARGLRTHTPVRNPSPAHRLHARLHSHDHALHTKFVPAPPATPRPPPLVAQQREFLSRAVLAQRTRDRYQAQVAYGDTAPDDEKVDPDTFICAEAPFPVSMLESYRNLERERRVLRGLPPLRSQERERLAKMSKELEASAGDVGALAKDAFNENGLQGVIDVCNNEQRLYDGVFAQIIEHESEVCHERGQLLANVRVLYQEMLNAIPFYMRKAQDNVDGLTHVNDDLRRDLHDTQIQLNDAVGRIDDLQRVVDGHEREQKQWETERQALEKRQAVFEDQFLNLRRQWNEQRDVLDRKIVTLLDENRSLRDGNRSGQQQSSDPERANAISARCGRIIDLAEALFAGLPDDNEPEPAASAEVPMASNADRDVTAAFNADMVEDDDSPAAMNDDNRPAGTEDRPVFSKECPVLPSALSQVQTIRKPSVPSLQLTRIAEHAHDDDLQEERADLVEKRAQQASRVEPVPLTARPLPEAPDVDTEHIRTTTSALPTSRTSSLASTSDNQTSSVPATPRTSSRTVPRLQADPSNETVRVLPDERTSQDGGRRSSLAGFGDDEEDEGAVTFRPATMMDAPLVTASRRSKTHSAPIDTGVRPRGKVDSRSTSSSTRRTRRVRAVAPVHTPDGEVPSVPMMTVPAVLRFIDAVLDAAYAVKVARNAKGVPVDAPHPIRLRRFIRDLLRKQHGLEHMVLSKLADVMRAIRAHRPSNRLVDLFWRLLQPDAVASDVDVLLRLRHLCQSSTVGVKIVVNDNAYICGDRAADIVAKFFADGHAPPHPTQTAVDSALVDWRVVLSPGAQVVSPRARPALTDLFNPHDVRWKTHPKAIEVGLFMAIVMDGIARADLDYDRDAWIDAAFTAVDDDGDGFISVEQFARTLAHTSPRYSDRDVQCLFQEATRDSDTKAMTRAQFRRVLCRVRGVHLLALPSAVRVDPDRDLIDEVVRRWNGMTPAYKRFLEMVETSLDGESVHRLRCAVTALERALQAGADARSIVDMYRGLLLEICHDQQEWKGGHRQVESKAGVATDLDRLEQLVQYRFVSLFGAAAQAPPPSARPRRPTISIPQLTISHS